MYSNPTMCLNFRWTETSLWTYYGRSLSKTRLVSYHLKVENLLSSVYMLMANAIVDRSTKAVPWYIGRLKCRRGVSVVAIWLQMIPLNKLIWQYRQQPSGIQLASISQFSTQYKYKDPKERDTCPPPLPPPPPPPRDTRLFWGAMTIVVLAGSFAVYAK